MITDPRTNAARSRHWALWLFMFVGVVLQSSLCPPNVHAGVLSATTRMCVSSAAGTPPPEVQSRAQVPDTDRIADAGHPCAPAPRPHHHPPCGFMNQRGPGQQRSLDPWQAGAVSWSSLPESNAARPDAPARVHSGSSRPPVPRSGAGLLIDLCSSRT